MENEVARRGQCGCVGLRVNNDSTIKYCPLHQAAPALLAALTGLLDALDRQYSEPDPERFYPGTTEYVLDNERIAARATVAEARGEAG